MGNEEFDRLEGSSSSVTLDHVAQTLVFSHHGAVATAEQKAVSPLVVPLGAIGSVECTPGRSTNWFWVVPRGRDLWRRGVWCDPYGVVCGVDPTAFAERVRSAVATATPVDAEPTPLTTPSSPKRGRFTTGLGKALFDGFFNTR